MSTPLVVILGAGRPYRGEEPSALAEMPGNRRVLDWILQAFAALGPAEICFVGGYGLERVLQRFPDIHYAVNPDWRTTGSVASLLAAPLDPTRTTYVCYADTVVAPEVVEQVRDTEADVAVAVDVAWRTRYEARAPEDLAGAEKVRFDGDGVAVASTALSVEAADAEFVGLLRLSHRAVTTARALAPERLDARRAGLPDLITALVASGCSSRAVRIAGQWAELNAPQDLARFVLGTKASTLERVRPLVRSSVVGTLCSFTAGEWLTGRDVVIQRIGAQFGDRRLAVRSSARGEDAFDGSQAGRYETVLDVPADDGDKLATAIERVVGSYGDADPLHQVLVQAFLDSVRMSGVVFTRTLSYGGPYYTISFDETAGVTDTVTSGRGVAVRTAVVYRDNAEAHASAIRPDLGQVVRAARELEDIAGYDSLDVEFAVTDRGAVHLLQLRPLAVSHRQGQAADGTVRRALDETVRRFTERQAPSPPLVGRRALFGVMPDWNPAEIVGTRPRPLALSLYQFLITDETWAIQRAEYGYRDTRPTPLIVSFAGHPYVDVRASFNSFIPATLPPDLAARLVDAWIDRLIAHPELHDKVEFDVAFTCLSSDFDRRARQLSDAGLARPDIAALRQALGALTSAALARGAREAADLPSLDARLARTLSAGLAPLDRAYVLLHDCRVLGCLPFAHLARSAFVATTLLRSFEAEGILDSTQVARFLGSIRTVARAFDEDGAAVAAGTLPWDAFVARYGHLRPGTYELTTPSYAEEPERFLKPMLGRTGGAAAGEVRLAPGAAAGHLQRGLAELGLPEDVVAFERFAADAIRGREQAKFVFTRHLDAAMTALIDFGRGHGLSRADLSYVRLPELLQLRTQDPPAAAGAWLQARVEEGRGSHRVAEQIELPPLLADSADFHAFLRPPSAPNYITRRRAVGRARIIGDGARGAWKVDDLHGAIVVVPQADPGFDWLFGSGIAGFVTLYGGANSHMAIRAAEFDIPAVIGVGEDVYERLARAEVLEIDCGARRVAVIQ